MIHDQFLYCRICHEVHHLPPFDRAPTYQLEGGTVQEIFTDDRRQFVDRHFGHEIEALKRVAENGFSIGRPVDPMKGGYVEVTNDECLLSCGFLEVYRRSRELQSRTQSRWWPF